MRVMVGCEVLLSTVIESAISCFLGFLGLRNDDVVPAIGGLFGHCPWRDHLFDDRLGRHPLMTTVLLEESRVGSLSGGGGSVARAMKPTCFQTGTVVFRSEETRVAPSTHQVSYSGT